MRSFALSALAFLTLGAFSTAAPTPVARSPAKVGVAATVQTRAEVATGKRGSSKDDDDKCLGDILDGIISDVTEIIDEICKLFNFYTLSLLLLTLYCVACIEVEITVEIIEPILKKVTTILSVAIEEVKCLDGLSVGSILKTVTGLLDLDAVVKLIADLLCVSVLSLPSSGLS